MTEGTTCWKNTTTWVNTWFLFFTWQKDCIYSESTTRRLLTGNTLLAWGNSSSVDESTSCSGLYSPYQPQLLPPSLVFLVILSPVSFSPFMGFEQLQRLEILERCLMQKFVLQQDHHQSELSPRSSQSLQYVLGQDASPTLSSDSGHRARWCPRTTVMLLPHHQCVNVCLNECPGSKKCYKNMENFPYCYNLFPRTCTFLQSLSDILAIRRVTNCRHTDQKALCFNHEIVNAFQDTLICSIIPLPWLLYHSIAFCWRLLSAIVTS